MKGFSAWPGKIDMPTDNMKRPAVKKVMHCVFFFGTHDYAWILDGDLKPYKEFKDLLNKKKASSSFKKAIAEMEEFLLTGKTCKDVVSPEDAEKDAEFDALMSGEKPKKTPAKSGGKKRSISQDSDEGNSNGTSSAKKPKGSAKKKARNDSENHTTASDNDRDGSPPLMNHSSKKSASSAVSNFLDRPTVECPASPGMDVSTSSQTLKDKAIEPSSLNFGFLGLGIMGSGIVKNLLNSGHKVTVWNRTEEKYKDFLTIGAKKANTPGDVIAESDITFSCVADPQVAKDMVFGNCGVLTEINSCKGYVEMTGIDPDTSQDIAEAISLKGGRYCEAQVQGSRDQSNQGTLVILVSGDRSLFDDCQSSFKEWPRTHSISGRLGMRPR